MAWQFAYLVYNPFSIYLVAHNDYGGVRSFDRHHQVSTIKKTIIAGILRDKTMVDTFMYIPNDNTQN